MGSKRKSTECDGDATEPKRTRTKYTGKWRYEEVIRDIPPLLQMMTTGKINEVQFWKGCTASLMKHLSARVERPTHPRRAAIVRIRKALAAVSFAKGDKAKLAELAPEMDQVGRVEGDTSGFDALLQRMEEKARAARAAANN